MGGERRGEGVLSTWKKWHVYGLVIIQGKFVPPFHLQPFISLPSNASHSTTTALVLRGLSLSEQSKLVSDRYQQQQQQQQQKRKRLVWTSPLSAWVHYAPLLLIIISWIKLVVHGIFVQSVLLPDGTPDVQLRKATGGQKLRDIMLDANVELYGPYVSTLVLY